MYQSAKNSFHLGHFEFLHSTIFFDDNNEIIIISFTMNETSRHSILTLPHTSAELQSNNRNKTGYGTFVSLFISEFNELSFDEKKKKLINNNIHSPNGYHRHERNPIIYDAPIATAMEKYRLASKSWGRLSDELKKCWSERADLVNRLPILGEVQELPPQVTNEEVITSINLELAKFVNIMHNSIRRGGTITESLKWKSFGKEKIIVRSKIFRSVFLSHLLKLTFFGVNCSVLKEDEIVYKRKKTSVIYIHSKQRMVDLFERGSISAFTVVDKNDSCKIVGCGGRFILSCRKTGMEVIGFVIEEKKNVLMVQLETNEEVEIQRPRYFEETDTWEYGCTDKYSVVEYDPVRIKLQQKGNTLFLFHVFKYKEDKDRAIEILPY